MKKLIVLAAAFFAIAAAENVGIKSVTETRDDGTKVTHSVIFTGSEYITLRDYAEAPSALPTDTGELWVDRNHRFAIVQGIAVQEDGLGIHAYWDLNNQRTAYYRTLGDGVPAWEAPGINNYGSDGHEIGASRHGEALCIGSANNTTEWAKVSNVPRWRYSYAAPGYSVSRCNVLGTRVASATNTGSLLVFDAQTGETLWTAPFNVSNGLQGVALSTDGAIVAVTVYDSAYIFENGTRRGAIPIGVHNSGTQFAAKLSGDGKYIVAGDYLGKVKLWRWSGAAYSLVWSAGVGNPWVTDVNISRDGSTIAAGTGYNSGLAVVFDSSSSTPLWTYQGFGAFGAEMSSCAVSNDGSRIAFASWGDTIQSGPTYVLTVHARDNATPLCGVTRDEEVGSLFCCDISGDGQYVTAGGKAVHAYRFGNGGEVYAFLIGHTPGNNAGVASIEAPTQYLQVGTPVSPSATVRNYGDSTITFKTWLAIKTPETTKRLDSVTVTNLAPQTSQTVAFSDWTPDSFNFYDFVYWTALAGDEFSGDDTLVLAAKCFHDAHAGAAAPPFAEMTVGYTFAPRLKVFNTGSYTDLVSTTMAISDSAGLQIYGDSVAQGPLNPGDSAMVAFTPLHLSAPGRYTAVAIGRSNTDDFVPGNDSANRAFLGTWEITYDDGIADAYYWVGRLDNDKFYQLMRTTAPVPFTITGGRIWVNLPNQTFAYVAVCKDDAGMPDTTELLQVDSAPAPTPSAPGWITFDLNIPRADSSPIWLIACWPSNSPGMGVGADANAPIDSCSYFSSNQDPFTLWWRSDWMMRLTQTPGASGIAQAPTAAAFKFALGAIAPNPFRGAASISYSLAAESHVTLHVFDAAGREVRSLVNAAQKAGNYHVNWNGRDRSGKPMSAGIYFCRMEVEGHAFTASRKLMLMR